MELIEFILLVILLLLSLFLQFVLLSQRSDRKTSEKLEELERNASAKLTAMETQIGRLGKTVVKNAERGAEADVLLRTEVTNTMNEGTRTQSEQLIHIANSVNSQLSASTKNQNDQLSSLRKTMDERLTAISDSQNAQLLSRTKTMDERLTALSDSQNAQLAALTKTMDERLTALSDSQNTRLAEQMSQVNGRVDRMTNVTDAKMDAITKVVDEKLDRLTGIVDQKLDETLNRRLDENFKQVGDQLGKLYKSLGELERLSAGVGDLNRTLSNVKTRGIFGEVQLGRILEETMASSQYEVNVATKQGSLDRVEYAVRFPAQDGSGEVVYLPIDAKFPSDIYNRIVDASANGDPAALAEAQRELRARIRLEAKDIQEKYLDVPRTTAYAILFLPTEGLYAETLRLDGLTEECQRIGVLLAGPTTITALLNSLQVGFRNIALSQKSVEIMRLLEAVKSQFGKMDDAIEKTRKKLLSAEKATDEMQKRTRIIQRQMHRIGEMEPGEAKRILSSAEDEEEEGEEA